MDLILGNFFSLLAMVSDSFSSSRKTVRSMLLVQCLGLFFFAVSSICLKGYSAAVQNVVSIFRNLLASSKYQSKKLEWFMVGLAVVLGLLFNNLGLIGALPVIGNLEYTLAMFRFRDNERVLKFAFLVNICLYAVFNLVIMNFVGLIANIVVVSVTASYLIRGEKQA